MDESFVTTIVCPQCHESLDPSAEVCHRCGAATFAHTNQATHTNQVNRDAHPGSSSSDRLIDKPWLIIVVLLHVGLLGIPMYWRTSYSVGVRIGIVLASIVYTVVAVGFIVYMLWWIMQSFSVQR